MPSGPVSGAGTAVGAGVGFVASAAGVARGFSGAGCLHAPSTAAVRRRRRAQQMRDRADLFIYVLSVEIPP